MDTYSETAINDSELYKSIIEHRKNIEALGLKRIGQSVVKQDTPIVRGMGHKVRHLATSSTVASRKAASHPRAMRPIASAICCMRDSSAPESR